MVSQAVKEFIKELEGVCFNRHTYEVFGDFLYMAQASIANAFYKSNDIEERYLQHAKRYDEKQLKRMARLLAITVEALEAEPECDFLGEAYMEALQGNTAKGQFFTPYSLAKMLTDMTFTKEGVADSLEQNGFISVADECSGAGCMLIAARNRAIELDMDANTVFMVAKDIDSKCVAMSYIQLSLLGVSAIVTDGNTLTATSNRSWFTPATFLNPNFRKFLNYIKGTNYDQTHTVDKTPIKPVQTGLF